MSSNWKPSDKGKWRNTLGDVQPDAPQRRPSPQERNTFSTDVVPDSGAIEAFKEHVYPRYADNDRVDILINNTDFGVGD